MPPIAWGKRIKWKIKLANSRLIEDIQAYDFTYLNVFWKGAMHFIQNQIMIFWEAHKVVPLSLICSGKLKFKAA